MNLHSFVIPLISLGWFTLRTGLQTCCGIHRCLRNRVGSRVQRICIPRCLEGTPNALAHQLPRVVDSVSCVQPPQKRDSRQKCPSPNRQYCDRCIHQLTSHVATCPLPSFVKSEASEVLLGYSHPGIHINVAADGLSRATSPDEWRLHPLTVQLIWRC